MRYSERYIFRQNISLIASRYSFDLDRILLNLYENSLSPLGYRALNKALAKILKEGAPGRRFPSIAYIRKLITGEPILKEVKSHDEVEARLVSSRLIEAVSKYGAVLGNDAEALKKLSEIGSFVGPLGWEIVQRNGGWNRFCEPITNANKSYMLAHYCDVARKIARNRALGLEGPLAKLPSPPKARIEKKSSSKRSSRPLFTQSILEMIRAPKKA